MSWWGSHVAKGASHVLGHWGNIRRTVIGGYLEIGGAILTAAAGWTGVGGVVGMGLMAAGAAYMTGDAAREAQKEAKQADKAAEQAEAEAKKGALADVAEAGATEDTAGDEAYKRKQKALAGATAGRGGTMNISSNLGGSSSLG